MNDPGAAEGRAYVIATLTGEPSGAELEALAGVAAAVEVRADLAGELAPETLRAEFSGELVYTLRSREEGGAARERGEERRERLRDAAAAYDLVDLEAARDLEPELLAAIPPRQRLVSWHGASTELDELWHVFEAMAATPARLYKLVVEVRHASEGLLPLAFLKSAERRDVVAFASGAAGEWTRLLAPRLGAPVVYGAAGEVPAAPGQPSVARLRDDFGLPRLRSAHRLYGVAGNPVAHSLSPRLYNRMFAERGLPALYLPFEVDTFGDFWLDLVESGSLEVLGFELRGLSVTAPFKQIALAVAGASSPLAEHIGSANTLTRHGDVWEAETTDHEGVLGVLRVWNRSPAGRAAVLGAGGAGRAAASGLARSGATVTLVNRGVERGRRVARELGLDFERLQDFDPAAFDLLVNATPLGRDEDDELPFEPTAMAAGAMLVDMTYRPDAPTRLVREVRAAGRAAVDGREVLLAQAVPQSLTMTGEAIDADASRPLLGLGAAAEAG